MKAKIDKTNLVEVSGVKIKKQIPGDFFLTIEAVKKDGWRVCYRRKNLFNEDDDKFIRYGYKLASILKELKIETEK